MCALFSFTSENRVYVECRVCVGGGGLRTVKAVALSRRREAVLSVRRLEDPGSGQRRWGGVMTPTTPTTLTPALSCPLSTLFPSPLLFHVQKEKLLESLESLEAGRLKGETPAVRPNVRRPSWAGWHVRCRKPTAGFQTRAPTRATTGQHSPSVRARCAWACPGLETPPTVGQCAKLLTRPNLMRHDVLRAYLARACKENGGVPEKPTGGAFRRSGGPTPREGARPWA